MIQPIKEGHVTRYAEEIQSFKKLKDAEVSIFS